MRKSFRLIGLGLTLIVPIIGCAASGWSTKPLADSAKKPSSEGTLPPSVEPRASETEIIQEVMTELQAIGKTDPAAQDKLLVDLKQADPSIWPLVMQQFRAEQAFRQRFYQERATAGGAGMPVSGFQPPSPPASFNYLPTSPIPASNPSSPPQAKAPPGTAARSVNHTPEASSTEAETPPSPDQVVLASFNKKAGSDEVQRHLEAAACAMESKVDDTPASEEDVARHVRLRMLYFLAGREKDALRPIPTIAPGIQVFWTKQILGLSAYLDTQRTPDPTQRMVEAKKILDESLNGLVEAAPLEIRNLAFCTEIQSYGCTTPFEKHEFEPGQEVLLYAEIENFTSEQTPRGYHTALRSSYQIFDGRQQRVADRDCPRTEEYCKNPRRDFFIGYHLVLPEEIHPGKHTLQLTIEDLKSRKIGQGSIDLTIKEPEQDSPAKEGEIAKK